MAIRLTAATGILASCLLLAVFLASAQPCIPCRDCKTNNCFRQCKAECPPQVNGDECRRLGRQYGRDVAVKACKTTEQFCNGGQTPVGARASRSSIGRVTLQQCANIAYGACQEVALNRNSSPCGRSLNGGFRQCSARQFQDFYRGEIDEYCFNLAKAIAP
jgi:hypothetical protein